MKIFKRMTLALAIITSCFVTVGLAAPASAALFENSVGEACKGATQGGTCNEGGPQSTIQRRIKEIIDLLTAVVGIAAVIAIIINGLRFITANGDANSISSARHGVIYALVGLVIVALAQAIVRFVLAKA